MAGHNPSLGRVTSHPPHQPRLHNKEHEPPPEPLLVISTGHDVAFSHAVALLLLIDSRVFYPT